MADNEAVRSNIKLFPTWQEDNISFYSEISYSEMFSHVIEFNQKFAYGIFAHWTSLDL